MHVLAVLTPLDPSSGSRVTVRASSVQDRVVNGLNNQTWRAAMLRKPTLTMKLFEGDFSTSVEPGSASFTLALDQLARTFANIRRFVWQGAAVTLYAASAATAWPWPVVFTGLVTEYSAQANRLELSADVDTKPFDTQVLQSTYAGTSGIEGGADLKGTVKPWVLGYARFVEPVLINAVDSVFQVSSYAAIKDVLALYERGAQFSASIGDYANYTALVAATIPAGRWATCKASGLIRLGAPPAGVITADVEGDYAGSTFTRLPGAAIRRAVALAGISSALVDTASFDALDTAMAALPNGGKINIVLRDQERVIDFARRIARSCNWQAGVDYAGKLFVTRPSLTSPTLTIDAQGRRKPGVLSASEVGVSPPYKKIQMSGARCWRRLSFDEIAFYSRPTPRGLYEAATTYREGDIVELIDGSTWLFVGATPLAGSYPAVGNANWDQMTASSRKIRYETFNPIATDSSVDDLLIRTDLGNKAYRRVAGDGILSFGGDPLSFGGVPLEFAPWQETTDTRVVQALTEAGAAATAATIAQALANDAQATADGKVQTYWATSAPTAEAVGDLWVDTDDDNKLYRWSGSAWVNVQDAGIGTAIAAAAGAQATADGKVTTFYTTSTPTAEALGDLWFNPSTQYLRRWNGSAWVDVSNIGATAAQIAQIGQALTDASNAQATADGKIVTFYQASAPGTGTLGDLWFDTDDGNKQYRHNGSSWVAVQDASIGTAITAAAGAQATADGKVVTFSSTSTPTPEGIGDLWFNPSTNYLKRWNGSSWTDVSNIGATASQITLISQALTDAANAQATADGKIDSFYQSSPPVTASLGDFWIDTGNGNRLYRWSGSGWVNVQDGSIGDAITAAAGAQATADGKVTTFVGGSAPTPEGIGDLWSNTSNGIFYRWNGTSWEEVAKLGADGAPGMSADLYPPTVQINTTSGGAPKSGELAKIAGAFILRAAGTVISSGVTYSIVASNGLTDFSIDSGGVFGPPGAIFGSAINATIRANYGGINYDLPFLVSKAKDGSGANSGSAPVTSLTGTGTYAANASIDLLVAAGATAEVYLTLISYEASSGNYRPQIKAAYVNITDGGSLTDISGTEAVGDTAFPAEPSGMSTGPGYVTNSTGAAKVFRFYFYSRRDGGSGGAAGVSGNITVEIA